MSPHSLAFNIDMASIYRFFIILSPVYEKSVTNVLLNDDIRAFNFKHEMSIETEREKCIFNYIKSQFSIIKQSERNIT